MFLLSIGIVVLFAILLVGLATHTYTVGVTGTGLTSAGLTVTVTAESTVIANPTAPAAKPGTLTVRTSATVGSLTMETGHGIITGQRFDLYWTGGQCYGCVAGTVAGLVVPIASTAGGDALPVAATDISVGIIEEAAFTVVGNNVQSLVISCPAGTYGYVVIADGSGDHLAVYVTGTTAYSWYTGSGITNPIAGDTATKIRVSQRSEASTSTQIQACAIVT